MTIDDFVKEEGISHVDFIKMDIEGSEFNALHGAEQTLRSFGPKLAIALYHHLDDFLTTPDYLSNLGVPYEFFLDHLSIHQEETILFASPLPDWVDVQVCSNVVLEFRVAPIRGGSISGSRA